MNKRNIISVFLLAVYVIAAVVNAAGILCCDCSAHHSHDICCSHHEQDAVAECGHDHSHCASFCDTEGFDFGFERRCSCNHRHGDQTVYTAASDSDKLLEYIKIRIGDAVRVCDTFPEVCRSLAATLMRDDGTVGIAPPPVICTGAPRAPSALV